MILFHSYVLCRIGGNHGAIPAFEPDGLLPTGDYEVSFDQLRESILVVGPGDSIHYPNWDHAWRRICVDNLEILTRQLWQVGIREVFADGSFAEDKDHPNDIDGYFVCDLRSSSEPASWPPAEPD